MNERQAILFPILLILFPILLFFIAAFMLSFPWRKAVNVLRIKQKEHVVVVTVTNIVFEKVKVLESVKAEDDSNVKGAIDTVVLPVGFRRISVMRDEVCVPTSTVSMAGCSNTRFY